MDAIKWLLLISIYNALIYTSVLTKKNLRVAFEWNTIDFSYTNENHRETDINSKSYIPEHNIPFDFDTFYTNGNLDSTVFVTIPRMFEGVPATVGYFYASPDSDTVKNTLITPYPSWEWHRDPKQCNPQRIVSAYSVEVDKCQRLWVLDSGVINKTQTCPPQILVFDLFTNNLIRSYQIPKEQLKPDSALIDIAVDITEVLEVISDCNQTYAYIADATGNGLIVYNFLEDTSRVFYHNSFKPESAYRSFNIDGTKFDMEIGISSLALASGASFDTYVSDKVIFYHSWSSVSENLLPSENIKSGRSPVSQNFVTIKSKKSTQSSAMAISYSQTVFFGSFNDCALKCWTLYGNYDLVNDVETLVKNPTTLQFPIGLKVVQNVGGKEELWILSNRLHKAVHKMIDPNDVNFRIQVAYVDDLIEGTKCKLFH